MATDRHYNITIHTQLARFAGRGMWTEMTEYLGRLSNADYRTAGYIVGERILPGLEVQAFWELFACLSLFDAKAFLVTVCKSAAHRIVAEEITLQGDALERLFTEWNKGGHDIDKQKFIRTILPSLAQPDDVVSLFERLAITDSEARLDYLLCVDSLPCAFVFFNTLKSMEQNPARLRHYCLLLMKKGTNMSYNLASIVKNYFDLTGVPGTFSLAIAPHEQNYLERSFDTFSKVMRSV